MKNNQILRTVDAGKPAAKVGNTCRISFVDRMNHGVLIKFEDGRCALFSEALLYATLPHAEKVDASAIEW